MPLEDHAGDIVRKSRLGRGLSSLQVANAAQVTEDQLSKFEEIGPPLQGINYDALASMLSLDGEKLKRIAEGWEPAIQALSNWHHLRQIETDDGGMAVNCFLTWDEETREAALFDTGWILRPIKDLIDHHNLSLQHIFITHSHYDHIEALAEVRNFAPEALIHSNIKAAPKSQQLSAEDKFSIGSLQISYRETPGHADDGVTYLVDGFPNQCSKIAIVGDAIFAGSIGGARNHFEMARSKIREEIFSLPNDTLICPGHGPVSTVIEEKKNNPFFP